MALLTDHGPADGDTHDNEELLGLNLAEMREALRDVSRLRAEVERQSEVIERLQGSVRNLSRRTSGLVRCS